MSQKPGTQYLKTQIMTASPEALQLMLWDGAIRFAEQGKDAILKKDIEGSYRLLMRSQKIIMEMVSSLRHDVHPELCKNLAALYTFIHRRLVDANVQKDVKAVDEAVELMRHQRQTWVMLMDKLSQERAATATTAQENAAALDAPINQRELAASSAAMHKPAALGRGQYPGMRPMAIPAATLSVQG
jgi:flagellar secretion chaperone FliS